MGARCWVAEFDLIRGKVSYIELPILLKTRNGFLVKDGDQDVIVADLDGGETCAGVFSHGETDQEIREELEETLRLRLAHLNLCHPNVPLKELQR
jgi:hypothetical protein